MPEFKALTREHRLRGYSWMRRAELIELIQNNQRNTNAPLQSWDPSIAQGNQTTDWGFSRASNRPPRPNRGPWPPPRWRPLMPSRSGAPLGLPQMSIWDPRGVSVPVGPWESINDRLRSELEAPLTKRQLKHRRNKDSKLNKEFKRLEADIDNLKSQMDSLKDKITKASESTNADSRERR